MKTESVTSGASLARAKSSQIVLSIDAATRSGFAAFVRWNDTDSGNHGGYQFQGGGSFQVEDEVDLLESLEMIRLQFSLPLPAPGVEWVAVIERDTNPNNRQTIEKLAAVRLVWKNALRRYGVQQILEVNPQWWQGKAGISTKVGKAIGDSKEASLAIASQVFGTKFTDPDAADACLMGSTWLTAGGLEGHQDRQKAKREKKKAKTSPEDTLKVYRDRGCL